ncbi:MAG: hypothetical protein A3A32_03450 [Candidatus Wildermuthbacteria bacterium RIFCSPLOWO2_01_FULL_48_35]|uniref:Uncharacterized protein n=2 Tax=Parcubacteria group TaxID=1794811 RepID=A0A1G2RQZ7_9BACT|nr:MAG: hypothetical protein UX72_C0003G0075 [Parcubacteria group bacterium GW2011_GWA2_47_10]OGZ94007.1 MAG: hypothetical protein A2633_01025 [Candidatus Sungbacteria bacterium RIFCSPHIGHO2_01_FULL_47_32]OHA74878.1 MAG: hypothetical protein A3A32_03450 [Candidatus Wildermuthbacteria bacterium RIFCSPLOWO2_01_FULL_48_35]
MREKLILGGVTVVVLAFLGGLFYYVWKTTIPHTVIIDAGPKTIEPRIAARVQPETLVWTEYKNKKYGYTIKFPSDWQKPAEDGNPAVFRGSGGREGDSLAVHVLENTGAVAADTWWKEKGRKTGVAYASRGEVIIPGIAVGFLYNESDGTKNNHLVFVAKGRIFHISGFGDDSIFANFINSLLFF